jgi:hypothetical protein
MNRQGLPRFRRAAEYPSVAIDRPKHQLLVAIGRYAYLTAEQLRRLLYGKSINFVRGHLTQLFHSGYLERTALHHGGFGGSALPVYTLTAKGDTYLRSAGIPPRGRSRPSERANRSQFTLPHTLQANDLVILCHLLCKLDSRFSVSTFEPESDLRKHPVKFEVHVDTGLLESFRVIPDAWVHLWQGEEGYPIIFELDRSTENIKDFRAKIRALIYYISTDRPDGTSPYERQFGIAEGTIAFVSGHADPKRVSQMLAWTEAELSHLGADALAENFRFAAFVPASADPFQVFVDPIWQAPFNPQPQPLLMASEV